MIEGALAEALSLLAIELRYAAGDCREADLSRVLACLADAIDRITR